MRTLYRSPVVAALALGLAGGAGAAHASEWFVRAGGHYVDPKSDNHAVVNVDAAESLTFNVTYMLAPHWGVELLAALPFSHDIRLNADGSRVAETKHLPPTLSVQYHFLPDARFRPYAGVGLNATLFFDEKTTGALQGSDLSLDDSYGPAAQLGMDVDLGGDWLLNVDARWFDIDSAARLDGAGIGTVSIDPYAFGLSVGRRFGGW
jgi:outer membrane protein